MSLTVDVVRDKGDIPGPEIVCVYFASENIFRQCGRVEIDKSAKGLKLVTITVPGIRRSVRSGKIIRLVDVDTEYRAKVKTIMFSNGIQPDGTPYASCSLTLRLMEVL